MPSFSDGLIIVAKRECPTCELLEPVYREISDGAPGVSVFSQDDPTFPASVSGVVDDTYLENSYRLDIETVPTIIRWQGGKETARAEGWNKDEWRALTGLDGLGDGLPDNQPGCGSITCEPGMPERLAVRFGDANLKARQIEIGGMEDDIESCFERGWSDGLPVVPPTEVRVVRMLSGTSRDPQEVLGNVPPNLAPITVEKVAINAVMAGCKPEYLPVVLAAVEAALDPTFCMHGLLCTTHFAAPMVIVNGPITKAIGMNSGGNALGQGNRANSTIGRALQLIIRNVGGGIPGGIDRATLGHPGKHTYCFAEDESNPIWEPLSVENGVPAGKSAVTVYAGEGMIGHMTGKSRTPESLTRSLAQAMRVTGHPRKMGHDAFVILSPEHLRVYADAGWSKARLIEEFEEVTKVPGHEIVSGSGGITEGVPADKAGEVFQKFRPGGIHIVRAGGIAGMMSAIVGNWMATGERGSVPVTKEVKP